MSAVRSTEGPRDVLADADGAAVGPRPGPLALLLSLFVRLYRLTAPFRQPRCRFHPSCSTYALEALTTHGALRGGWLAARRLLRCHPWNPGGVDHVPPRSSR